ncbi:MAG: hypothetical protein IT372_10390 [Polyangiaceae bacterium]|nr:hypothetical protein [Polyangiaceae bacterium]
MPAPPSSRSRALAALTLAAALLVVARAGAAPLPRLVVHRAPAAADCPDAAALAAAVERLMQRPALDPAAAEGGHVPLYEVQILRVDEGYASIIQAGGRTRQISDPGATCAELSEALALTLAILLDSDAPRPPPAPPPALPPPPVALPPPPPRPPAPPRRRWDASIDLGAAQTLGFLTPLSWAFVGEASLRLRAGSIGAGAILMPARTLDQPPGTVDVSLAAATARACAALLGDLEGARLSACFQPILGSIHGQGHGYSPDREGSATWLSLGAGALAEGPLAGPIGWSARATFVVPLTSESFTVDVREDGAVRRVTAFDPSPAGLLVGVGLRATIW